MPLPEANHVFYDVDATTPEPRPRWHGSLCTPECDALSRPCHLHRPSRRLPALEVPCTHCGAEAGRPCHTITRNRDRLTKAPGECHPSRLEAA
ncbi:zinc finger domain-containing protein [Nocardioides sp. J54]|uniref:zinc finger domain-containing protein n=1 Tax=Nocardioides sp. J54 TaxID=935866 RepID=UPI003FA52FDF